MTYGDNHLQLRVGIQRIILTHRESWRKVPGTVRQPKSSVHQGNCDFRLKKVESVCSCFLAFELGISAAHHPVRAATTGPK